MKKLVIVFFLLQASFCFGQLESSDITFAATAEYINFQKFSPTSAYGVTGEYMLGKHVGIEFSVAGSKDYFHFGTGAILFPVFMPSISVVGIYPINVVPPCLE